MAEKFRRNELVATHNGIEYETAVVLGYDNHNRVVIQLLDTKSTRLTLPESKVMYASKVPLEGSQSE